MSLDPAEALVGETDARLIPGHPTPANALPGLSACGLVCGKGIASSQMSS